MLPFFAERFGGRQPAHVAQFLNPPTITAPSHGENALHPEPAGEPNGKARGTPVSRGADPLPRLAKAYESTG